MLNTVKTPRDRYANFSWVCRGAWRLCHEELTVLDYIKWSMDFSRGIVWERLGDQCKPASMVTSIPVWLLSKPCGQRCPWRRWSPAACHSWLWAAEYRVFPPALAAAWCELYWAREHRALLEGSGETSNGCISLEAARRGKHHEIHLADIQQYRMQCRCLNPSCLQLLPQGPILCWPAPYRYVGYPTASQMVLDAVV